jgi:hypothetical protein
MMKAKGGAIDFRGGGHVPGKAKVDGDSPKNDTVPAWLSPGEIVIPRSKVKDPEAAKRFIEETNAKEDGGHMEDGYAKGGKIDGSKQKDFIRALQGEVKSNRRSAVGAPKDGYSKVLHSHRMLDKRLKDLESKMKKRGA